MRLKPATLGYNFHFFFSKYANTILAKINFFLIEQLGGAISKLNSVIV